MMDSKSDNLFEAFPPISKAEWLAKVEKDLRGKPLADLRWQLEEEIELEPFYHPDDIQEQRPPLHRGRSQNHWEIGEYIKVSDPKTGNVEALEALAQGVNSPVFRLRFRLKKGDMEQLLESVELPMIATHFTELYTDKEPLAILETFINIVQKRAYEGKSIRGSIDFDPMLDWEETPVELFGQALQMTTEYLPLFKILQVNGRYYHAGPAETARELGLMLAKAVAYLNLLGEYGFAPETVQRHLQFSIGISISYFVEIAKIRALRILWNNALAAYGLENAISTEIVAHLAPETLGPDPHTNMIQAGTQAMSAIIGGADRLYIRAANHWEGEQSNAFTRRIARNVQHILELESYLGRVLDPAAGSFYIETLTSKLAQKGWEFFQQFEKQGEFYN